MNDTPKAPPQRPGFPLWGTVAIPAGLLWGAALGAGVGLLLGNALIGVLIGAGLGIGIGLTVFAAAIVIASGRA